MRVPTPQAGKSRRLKIWSYMWDAKDSRLECDNGDPLLVQRTNALWLLCDAMKDMPEITSLFCELQVMPQEFLQDFLLRNHHLANGRHINMGHTLSHALVISVIPTPVQHQKLLSESQ
ncbi:hypothetical protein NDU88_002400 [Pleurodeles waltl]|uniref:Uncharacterized protein n=1 Tax=Pleurodeles waltl TaxID=8319 RepID=A0AAV7UYC1_PLEWA|nr:hypothetical protein NDU88_002400 [Pleurodeles waltl]